MPARLVLLVVGMLLVSATGCDIDGDADTSSVRDNELFDEAVVVRVVDGDTIIVRLDGREERLRYIGIDAPESVQPDMPIECYGPESSDENMRLVDGATVFLEADTEERDRFDRLLRYVYISGPDGELVMVNRALVAGGFAEAGSFPPNERHSDSLFDAEREARVSGVGLWSACR